MHRRLFFVWLLTLCMYLCLEVKADTDGLTASKLKLLPRYCGLAVSSSESRRSNAKLFEYPWIALLQYDHEGEIEHRCSSSLLNNRYVLTAAHCLINQTDLPLLNVRLGEFDKSKFEDCETKDIAGAVEKNCAEPADDYDIELITIHPEFDQRSFENDIGLIRLNRDVTMHDNTSPICLPVTSSVRSSIVPKFIATGWGSCVNRTNSNELQASLLDLVDSEECNRAISNGDQKHTLGMENQFCATSFTGIDVGGPLGVQLPHPHSGHKFVLLGIASGVVESLCQREGTPGVYTRVSNYMEWILDSINP